MKSLPYLLALVAIAAACKSQNKAEKSDLPRTVAPKFEKMKTMYEVLDNKTGMRLGFLEKTFYDDGSIVYWVTGTDRETRLGYFLDNGRAYKYEWIVGKRTPDATFLGADSYFANARKILGHNLPVHVEEISVQELMREYESKGAPTPAAAKKAEDDESGEE